MEEKIRELVKNISSALNSFSFNYDEFCRNMGKEHRTLQQSFTRLCIYWLRYCAKLENYDGRNEESVKVGRIVTEALDAADIRNVPMV